jgi:hypothetical protein
MAEGSDTASPRRQPLTIERLAPALILVAEGGYARRVARSVGVSTTTILNWMDWAWEHRPKVEAYLHEHYPDVSEETLEQLWARMRRRQEKRRRRLNVRDVLSSGPRTEGSGSSG